MADDDETSHSYTLRPSPEVDRLADLGAWNAELILAIRLMDKAREIGLDDIDMRTAFSELAIIAYNRCFASGVRTRLAANDVVPSSYTREHTLAVNLRNRFVAHSVSVLEQSVVVVNPDSPTWPGVTDVFAVTMRTSLPARVITDLLELFVVVRDGLTNIILAAKIDVLSSIGTLTRDDLVGYPQPRLQTVPLDEYDIARARVQGTGNGIFVIPG